MVQHRAELFGDLRKQLADCSADVILSRPAVDLLQGTVDPLVAQLSVQESDPDGGCVEQGLEQRDIFGQRRICYS
jgi:hypothetical protein